LQKTFLLLKKIIFFFCLLAAAPAMVFAQAKDSITVQKDSLQDTVVPVVINKYNAAVRSVLDQNIFLNSDGIPVTIAAKPKATRSNDAVFYLLAGLIFLVGIIKLFFSRYFTNLFRVFFNTSLRQSQLADQLLQAKLPSLFFNAFFIISGGVYTYFLLAQYGLIKGAYNWMLLGACVVTLGIIYVVKFSALKFTGWITGYKESADTYIFIIFMICKIIGIILLPFTVLIAFSDAGIATVSALVSLLIIGFLLLLRFFRSYGLIRNQLKVSKFHFFLYIAGVEIIPLLLIYKAVLFLLSKKL
jgi:hypothetical protein